MTNERLRVKGEFIKLLLLEDLRDYDPSYDPYVYTARSHLALQNLDKITAQVKEFIGVRSGLVSIDAKDRCLGQIEFQDLDFIGNDYFEDGGKYVTGEEFEKKGISLEIVNRERGLLIVRYSERILETHHALEGLPAPFQRPTKHGRQAWIIDKAPLNPDQTMYFSRLWEAFGFLRPPNHRDGTQRFEESSRAVS